MTDLLHDVRLALRALRRQPGFSAVAILTLALGIGATTAVFSIVYGVLLRPLPYPDADRLVRVYATRDGAQWTASPPDFTDWRAQATSFEDLAALTTTSLALTGDGPARQHAGAQVTAAFFSVLGVAPALGRGFTEAHEVPGQDGVVVLSHALWSDQFGADPGVLGRTLRLDGVDYEVIGVMPPGFAEPGATELWVPLAFTADDLTTQRGAHYLDVYGRLRPDVTLERADREVHGLAARLDAAYPDANPGWRAQATSLRDALVGDVQRPLYAVLGAVGLVLLMTCVNVASLLLSRAVARDHEIAIRVALGVDRLRLVRSVLAESLVLALAGGALGVALATWGIEALARLAPADLPRMDQVGVNPLVLGFTLGISGLTALLFGAAPSFQLLRRREATAVVTGTRGGTAGRAAQRWRRALVTAQIACAVTLVAGAGLLIKSFGRLMATDPGFRPDGVLTFNLALPDGYAPARVAAFASGVEERLRALPGVEDVGLVFGLPLSGLSFSISVYALDGRTLTSAEQERLGAQIRFVTPGYFPTIGMTVLRGRGITPADGAGGRPVAVINETAARRLFGDDDPIGRHLEFGTRMGLGGDRLNGEIVGVVRDVKDVALGNPARGHVYFAHAQWPVGFLQPVLRTGGDPEALATAARNAVAAVDPDVPVYRVRTLTQLRAASAARERFLMLVLGVFAGAALLLAAVGIYGVVAHAVAQRTRELGIRMALGARAADILWLVLRQGVFLGGTGAALGLVGALAASRVLEQLLYQVTPSDPATLALGAGGLLVVTLAATYLPARRAAGVDPVEALRHE
jgi:putative ABC transport system permease protein